jgi:hypothetical protein
MAERKSRQRPQRGECVGTHILQSEMKQVRIFEFDADRPSQHHDCEQKKLCLKIQVMLGYLHNVSVDHFNAAQRRHASRLNASNLPGFAMGQAR